WTKRVRLIQEEEQGESVVALSEHYGVSRKTLYKWLARDEEHDTAGWAERNAVNPKRETARRRLSFHKTPAALSRLLLRFLPHLPHTRFHHETMLSTQPTNCYPCRRAQVFPMSPAGHRIDGSATICRQWQGRDRRPHLHRA